MTIIGIPVRIPSAKGMLVVGGFVLTIVLINYVLNSVFDVEIREESFFMFVSAILGGALSSAFGINIAEHGWRAMILLLGISAILYGLTYMIIIV